MSTRKSAQLILFCDSPEPFFPVDDTETCLEATAEWEDEKTIQAIAHSWELLGYQVQTQFIKGAFLKTLSEISEDTLVHSLCEGWGSLAREAWIPSLCELCGVPWIGSSPAGICAAMDKDLTSQICQSLNIPAPKGQLCASHPAYMSCIQQLSSSHHFVKPNAEGSGMGIGPHSLRTQASPLTENEFHALLCRYPDGLRVEVALPGPEFTTALVGSPPTFLPVAQVKVPGDIYGLAYKGKDAMKEEVTFPNIDASMKKNLQAWSLQLWQRLQLMDFCRFDWKCDEQGVPHLIDINPLAGLSPHYSVLPLMWKTTGKRYEELLETLAEAALKKCDSRRLKYGKLRRSVD